MNKRRILAGLVVAAVAVAAVLLLIGRRGSSAGEEERIAADVAVHVGTITRMTLRRFVTAYGVVEPEPPAEGRPGAGAEISAPVGGILAEIRCVEGRDVERGAILFRLDTRLAEVAVARAEKGLEFAEATYERQKNLLAAEATSQKAFQEAESQLNTARADLASARTELSLLEIKAPLAGTVIRINARPGRSVEPNAVLAEVVDFHRLVVTARVPGRDAAALAAGQPVDFGPDRPGSGKVIVVGRDIDPRTETVLVRASLPAETAAAPGQFLTVRIVCEERTGVLAVPEECVVSGAGGESVIMIVEGDRAVPKPVSVGLRDGGFVEVTGDRLKEGLTVVTADAYTLTGETKIHIVGEKSSS